MILLRFFECVRQAASAFLWDNRNQTSKLVLENMVYRSVVSIIGIYGCVHFLNRFDLSVVANVDRESNVTIRDFAASQSLAASPPRWPVPTALLLGQDHILVTFCALIYLFINHNISYIMITNA